MELEITFSDEELLRIMEAPGEDARTIFAEGYCLPEAYPAPAGQVACEYLLPWSQQTVYRWEYDLRLEANWAAVAHPFAGAPRVQRSVCPIWARDDLQAGVRDCGGKQAA